MASLNKDGNLVMDLNSVNGFCCYLIWRTFANCDGNIVIYNMVSNNLSTP